MVEEQEEQEYSMKPHGEELKLEFHSPLSLLNTGGVPLVTDGMYWSKEVGWPVTTSTLAAETLNVLF